MEAPLALTPLAAGAVGSPALARRPRAALSASLGNTGVAGLHHDGAALRTLRPASTLHSSSIGWLPPTDDVMLWPHQRGRIQSHFRYSVATFLVVFIAEPRRPPYFNTSQDKPTISKTITPNDGKARQHSPEGARLP